MVKEFYYPNLLIVSGTGTKAGKTTIACRIIEQFRNLSPVAIKISPHFHTSSPGLVMVEEGSGFAVYEETNAGTSKDTSRMLKAGAAKVLLILAWDYDLKKLFRKVISGIPGGTPVICESPALRNYFEPGLFIIMASDNPDKRYDLNHLAELPHQSFNIEQVTRLPRIPFDFFNNKWQLHKNNSSHNSGSL